MKKKDVEKQLKRQGWWLKRHGGGHDIWTNGIDSQPVPRHKEVNEILGRKILNVAKSNPGDSSGRK